MRKSMVLPWPKANWLSVEIANSGCEIVQLYGNLRLIRCELCHIIYEVDKPQKSLLLNRKAPECQFYYSNDRRRQDQRKSDTKICSLRPNFVLYGEKHLSVDVIRGITTNDLALFLDMLLILGTSLYMHWLKILIKEFAKWCTLELEGKWSLLTLRSHLKVDGKVSLIIRCRWIVTSRSSSYTMTDRTFGKFSARLDMQFEG